MLQDNIRNFRRQQGMTQEELAIRLNVVRQTVSKWEKGLSVPDAELLQRLADVLEVTVTQLLSGTTDREPEHTDEIARQLTRINEQLAARNRRVKWLLRVLGVLLGLWLLIMALTVVAAMVFSYSGSSEFGEVIVHEAEYQETVSQGG